MAKIAIGLMVKDESVIIERCLESIAPIADMVVITDTGSTDDTVFKAAIFLQKHSIPFKIYNEQFKDFSYNRNLVLEKIRQEKHMDYAFLIDADEVLSAPEFVNKSKLVEDYYNISIENGGISYYLPRLTKNNLSFAYIGVTHEYLDTREHKAGNLPVLKLFQLNDSSRRKSNLKFKEDVALLKAALNQENLEIGLKQRYSFYLAQTYKDLHVFELAYEWYARRFELGGWQEELGYCQYMMGKILLDTNKDKQMAVNHLLVAAELMPDRIEPLVLLRNHWRSIGLNVMADIINPTILCKPKPMFGLFIEKEVYVRR